MKQCRCGFDNVDANQLCSECGSRLDTQSEPTALAAEEIATSELERCAPVVQKYVETLKADNLALKRRLANYERIKDIVVPLLIVIGAIILISLWAMFVASGQRTGGL